MTFRNRLLLGMALIMAAFIAAIVVANSGLRSTSARFGSFLDGIGSLQQSYQEMYSQGLQMGQALRNIVLDPSNPKAFENLEKARKLALPQNPLTDSTRHWPASAPWSRPRLKLRQRCWQSSSPARSKMPSD